MKIALGTVQFGLKYGIANQSGQVAESEVRKILSLAQVAGIDTLDTAVGYGESEAVLGRAGVEGFRIVSKLPELPTDCLDITQWVLDEVHGSLARLGIAQLDALLLHEPDDLLGSRSQEYQKALQYVKGEQLVKAVGVSVYRPAELDLLFPSFVPDMIQIPCNVLDRRLVNSGWLSRLRDRGVRVHVRSAFLQGLLVMDRALRPVYFDPWAPLLDNWLDWCTSHQVTPLQAALSYPLSLVAVERVVAGVDSMAQLAQIVEATRVQLPPVPEHLSCDDVTLIEPFRWKTT
ncbi:MAG: aldo/keto reductase [Candidatus Methylacidiphilales bacterium]|nr:aldo/keto reductase [Candidatus Methylacidiphilales bacterium]